MEGARRSRRRSSNSVSCRSIASAVTFPAAGIPLPSSLLMTAIPARVAGVREIIAVCPRPDAGGDGGGARGRRLAAVPLGGAHAVAALAYGTASVPRVDKIVGPGNRYVAAAKALVAADCGIDFYAGPTEIVIVATRGPAEWIAADLIAQAEHDPDARAVLITPSRALADAVGARGRRGRCLPTGPARESLARARRHHRRPDHVARPWRSPTQPRPSTSSWTMSGMAAQVRSAGALFVGPWSAQVAGDYAIGSNHVLPTAGAARVRGGLSAADFVRQITVQRLTAEGPAQHWRRRSSLSRRAEGSRGRTRESHRGARVASERD